MRAACATTAWATSISNCAIGRGAQAAPDETREEGVWRGESVPIRIGSGIPKDSFHQLLELVPARPASRACEAPDRVRELTQGASLHRWPAEADPKRFIPSVTALAKQRLALGLSIGAIRLRSARPWGAAVSALGCVGPDGRSRPFSDSPCPSSSPRSSRRRGAGGNLAGMRGLTFGGAPGHG
jgi:hypothetical protein